MARNRKRKTELEARGGDGLQALSRSINEILVLGSLRGGEKHGYQIARDVARGSGGRLELRHGTLYPILHRLEERGWIEGHWEMHGARRRKVYRLTPSGRRHLGGEADEFEALVRGILRVVRGADGSAAS
ncbi:MAG TPA: helix-turn-helix transcriptional regulator [Longimicrobiales bacterium]|nr:helix-turn-helix transcriptional regulator [Longimicrobiales bacterium]